MAITDTIRSLISEYLVDFSNIQPTELNSIDTQICDALDSIDSTVLGLSNTLLGLMPKNEGTFTGLNVGNSIGTLTVSGDISSAVASTTSNNSIVTITLANAMANTNYDVTHTVQGLSADVNNDNDIGNMVFKIISPTQIQVAFKEVDANTQNIKVRIKVWQNS